MLTPARFPALFLLLVADPVPANDFQVWTNASAQGSLAGDLLYTADTSVRFGNDATQWAQTVVRGGLGWRVSPRLSLWGGYAHIRGRLPASGSLVEHRIWQQASYPILSEGKLRLSGRTRLEQRWLEGRDGTSWRLRQQVRLAVPLGEGPRPTSFTAAYELFWNLEDGGIALFREGADQGRLQAGLSVPLSQQLRVEPGYMRQRLQVPNPDRVNDIVQISLAFSL